MQGKTIAVILTILSALIASCAEPEREAAEQRTPVSVRTHVVEMTEVPLHFEAPGTIRAAVSTVVSSRVSGQIATLALNEGDRVRRDQVIAEIDSRDAAARLRGAQAGLTEAVEAQQELERGIRAAEAAVKVATSNRDLAETTLNRYTVLRDRKSVSPQEFDEVEGKLKVALAAVEQASESLAATQAKRSQLLARIDQAKAQVDVAAAALADYKITSPIEGTVTEKRAEPGMMATPGMPLVAIEDDSRYELEVAVEEARLAGIRIGQQAAIQIGTLNQSLTGRVVRIVPVGDPASRTYTVRLELRGPGGRLIRSGFFGRAIFDAGMKAALLVPRSAVIERGELSGVYAVTNGAAVFRIVRPGEFYGDDIEILSGLKPGERIVLTPGPALGDNAPVVESGP